MQSETEAVRSRLPLLVGVGVLFILGALIVIGVFVAARSTESSAIAVAPGTLASASFPAPPRGAVVFARQDGTDALALALRPRGNRLELQASVVGRQGTGVPRLGVSFRVQPGSATPNAAKPCGAGCYRTSVPLPARPRAVTVEVSRGGRKTVWRVPIAVWPPRNASALVARAEQVWRNLRSFEFDEQLASDANGGVDSTWKVVAPDKLAYDIPDTGAAGVVIGAQRWDRQDGKWTKSQQTPLDLPQPTWRPAVANAHVIGTGVVRGAPVTRVSFYDDDGRAWFIVDLEKKTTRPRDLHMTTTAHFMRQTFSGFNKKIDIRPPVPNP